MVNTILICILQTLFMMDVSKDGLITELPTLNNNQNGTEIKFKVTSHGNLFFIF